MKIIKTVVRDDRDDDGDGNSNNQPSRQDTNKDRKPGIGPSLIPSKYQKEKDQLIKVRDSFPPGSKEWHDNNNKLIDLQNKQRAETQPVGSPSINPTPSIIVGALSNVLYVQ